MSNIPLRLQFITVEDLDDILQLTCQLYPTKSIVVLKEHHHEMFKFSNYHCFGLYEETTLIGLCSGWITVRLYSGKQLELDNLMIDPQHQSKGYGTIFINLLEQWAQENACLSVELNTYNDNYGSHKFYFNQGYAMPGFHFLKKLKK